MSDQIPASVRQVLPGHTAVAWSTIIPYLPDGGYLAGGTAIAVHLTHRVSRDLDIFTRVPFDEKVLRHRLVSELDFYVSESSPGTVNGYLGETKVQILDASSQRMLSEPTAIGGMPVAGLEDLMAMKIKVIGDRGELRDYFDLMELERRTGLMLEVGLGDYVERFDPPDVQANLSHLVRALASFGDVADDPGLPVPRTEIEAYWSRRAVDVAKSLSTRPSLGRDDRPGTSTVTTSDVVLATCGRWMPRARSACVAPPGHAGGCRSSLG